MEVKLGQTWSKHGPDMVPKNRQYIEMGLRPFRFSVESFIALAGLEVKLGQAWSYLGSEIVLKVVSAKTSAVDHDDSILKIIEL